MNQKTIHLGFEVGTGDPVEIPIRHMVVSGQSQRAGKTTALEGLIGRSNARALAFVTKRGEGSFEDATRIRPFFREHVTWQSVEAILEQHLRQRMKFERAWLMRAVKGATTLKAVLDNVRRLQGKATRSMDQDVYMLLGAYLEEIVPEIAAANFASDLVLGAGGLRVMDLTAMHQGVQGLVIASCMTRVYEQQRDVITVVPEAWEYVPESRGSVVKIAAVQLARKGAALGNVLWLDSQDIAGVSKEVIRQSTVWLLGVQRELNEVKRTIAHIPAGLKRPSAKDVATLQIGQFFACWDDRIVKVYAQPLWLPAGDARLVAITGGTPVMLAAALEHRETHMAKAGRPPMLTDDEEEDMSKEDLGRIESKMDQLLEKLSGLTPGAPQERAPGRMDAPAAAAALDEEELFQRFLARLRKEAPKVLAVMATKPVIDLKVETHVITVDGSTIRGRLALLIREGFFDEAKANNAVYLELTRRGCKTSNPSVWNEMEALTTMGFLTKEGKTYLAAPDAKGNIRK